ncbi:hypothetical protein HYX08_03525 [Candidatus Woesearchaeota archaeon]|nr:hypothetical protein [Candidatus Woesearchaeota archaeon]
MVSLENKIKILGFGTAAVGTGLAAAGVANVSDVKGVNELLTVTGGQLIGAGLVWAYIPRMTSRPIPKWVEKPADKVIYVFDKGLDYLDRALDYVDRNLDGDHSSTQTK